MNTDIYGKREDNERKAVYNLWHKKRKKNAE